MLNISQYYSPRELFGLYFMIYVNYLMAGYGIGGRQDYETPMINHTLIYSCIDTIWLYFDTITPIRVPKNELYLHHAVTILLIGTNTPSDQKVGLIYIEMYHSYFNAAAITFPVIYTQGNEGPISNFMDFPSHYLVTYTSLLYQTS